MPETSILYRDYFTVYGLPHRYIPQKVLVIPYTHVYPIFHHCFIIFHRYPGIYTAYFIIYWWLKPILPLLLNPSTPQPMRLVNAVLASARPQHHGQLGLTPLVSILAQQRRPGATPQKASLLWFLGPEIIINHLLMGETSSQGHLMQDNDYVIYSMGPKKIWTYLNSSMLGVMTISFWHVPNLPIGTWEQIWQTWETGEQQSMDNSKYAKPRVTGDLTESLKILET